MTGNEGEEEMPGAPGGGAVVATESLPIHPFLAPVLVALTAFRSNAENVHWGDAGKDTSSVNS